MFIGNMVGNVKKKYGLCNKDKDGNGPTLPLGKILTECGMGFGLLKKTNSQKSDYFWQK